MKSDVYPRIIGFPKTDVYPEISGYQKADIGLYAKRAMFTQKYLVLQSAIVICSGYRRG
jgi:hypothetical protein